MESKLIPSQFGDVNGPTDAEDGDPLLNKLGRTEGRNLANECRPRHVTCI